jgi:hypothetical protein
MWHSQCRQIRQGLTLDGSNPEDEALPAAYVGELQRLAAQRCSEMPRGRLDSQGLIEEPVATPGGGLLVWLQYR